VDFVSESATESIDPIAALEAILFVTEAPVPPSELAEVLEIPSDQIETIVDQLARRLIDRDSGLTVRRSGGGYRLYSRADTYPYLERFSSSATARRISPAALEVLSVIAYRQPVSRSQIAEIRGVDSDSSVRSLERMGLITEVGRLSVPGNPAIYATSELFLEKMGINGLDELPPLADHVPPADIVETLEETFKDE
jgi:segregation and condensation protein B